jgi:uncharacterized protein with HEPN domain
MPPDHASPGREDRIRLQHMRLAALDARSFAADRSRADLDSDAMLRRALTHALQEIGEAAAKVSQSTRDAVPELPWIKIVGMRHILVHVYYAADHDTIWRVATEHLPTMLATLDRVLGPPQ